MFTRADIQIRDPFVVPVPEENTYYLFGTTDKNAWDGPGTGFDCYTSPDLHTFAGPFPAFRPPPGFWGTTQFWAPEVHRYRDRWYLLASFKAPGVCRGTQILAADHVGGPYPPHSPSPVTPPDWECLDGTLHVDPSGQPWMVFCHEWVQIGDGTICALRLSADLRRRVSDPIVLFAGSSARWANHPQPPQHYITDGPFVYRTATGSLRMLWSTVAASGYALGVATSPSGDIRGPWHHDHPPLFAQDGGHGMVFRRLDGPLLLALHCPNHTPHERPLFVPLTEATGQLHQLEVAPPAPTCPPPPAGIP